MTKCIFKALKAVDLEKHVGLFRSLGYDSAGALAHFRAEHFQKLNFNEQELLHLISLLDVLKQATREGKICPHYFHSTKTTKQQTTIKSAPPVRASWNDETVQQRNAIKKQSNDNIKSRRSKSSIEVTRRSPSASVKTIKNYSNEFISQKTSTVVSREYHVIPTNNTDNQKVSGPRSFLNRPAVQHVKVRKLINRKTFSEYGSCCLNRYSRHLNYLLIVYNRFRVTLNETFSMHSLYNS
jgi:hypothetical protein